MPARIRTNKITYSDLETPKDKGKSDVFLKTKKQVQ
jgi:hypothetical protein